ncbi:hypothetical protein [Paraflavitalea pollutisoli]|uniref:hypothetical protein n=1 Tax=Paraflavitalea pollutisoli TaxID=3034143 RepID=UPI0023EDE4FF|nr:hypothetical protein [Paraflavitalea sp. H1-2-19X]
MIQSRIVTDILELALDGDEADRLLYAQLPFLQEDDYEYTGYGLFISFTHTAGIMQHKYVKSQARLNGVELVSKKVEGVAQVDVVIADYLIKYIEISMVEHYPNHELQEYTLTQTWIGSPGRQITR